MSGSVAHRLDLELGLLAGPGGAVAAHVRIGVFGRKPAVLDNPLARIKKNITLEVKSGHVG